MILFTRLAPSAAVAAALLVGAPASAAPERYEIDQSHFSIVFNVDHVGFGGTWGMFLDAAGGFSYDADAQALSELSVTIQTASIFTNHEKRDEHLRGGDFLMAAENPEITFVATSAEATSATTGTVTGDLTLRGVSRSVTLDVVLNKADKNPFSGKHTLGITATTTILRSEWGMDYGVANGAVGDEVPIVIELEAARQ